MQAIEALSEIEKKVKKSILEYTPSIDGILKLEKQVLKIIKECPSYVGYPYEYCEHTYEGQVFMVKTSIEHTGVLLEDTNGISECSDIQQNQHNNTRTHNTSKENKSFQKGFVDLSTHVGGAYGYTSFSKNEVKATQVLQTVITCSDQFRINFIDIGCGAGTNRQYIYSLDLQVNLNVEGGGLI